MGASASVEWYGDEVLQLVDAAIDEFLTKLAFQGEAFAKVGANVDTGFMRNAIYGMGPNDSHRNQAETDAKSKADREFAREPGLEAGAAAIHGAAEYTIYQEERVGFMYEALEQLKGVLGATVAQAGKEHLGD